MEEKKAFRVTLEDLQDGEKNVLETNCLLLFAVQEDPAGEYTESFHWVNALRGTDYDMTVEEREAYWERQKVRQIKIDENVRMLDGCKCRLCVSDDKDEMYRMFFFGVSYLSKLLDLGLNRIKEENGADE